MDYSRVGSNHTHTTPCDGYFLFLLWQGKEREMLCSSSATETESETINQCEIAHLPLAAAAPPKRRTAPLVVASLCSDIVMNKFSRVGPSNKMILLNKKST
jgi:hypothetical protein